jgi:hypothetical protein
VETVDMAQQTSAARKASSREESRRRSVPRSVLIDSGQ